MLAQLGTIRFEGLKGFESISRRRAANYAEHAKINNKSSLQKVGDALTEISISVRLHRDFCVPEDEVRALESVRANGDVLSLVWGTGEYLGDFVLSEMNEDFGKVEPNGKVIYCDVSLTLTEYFNANKIESQERAAINSAIAIRSDEVKPLRLTGTQKPSEAGDIAKDVQDINMSARDIDSSIAKIDASPSREQFHYSKIQESLNKVQQKCSSVTAKLDNALELQNQVPNLKNVINTLSNSAATFQSTFPPSSLGDVKSSNSAFQSSVGNVNSESNRLNILIGTRAQ